MVVPVVTVVEQKDIHIVEAESTECTRQLGQTKAGIRPVALLQFQGLTLEHETAVAVVGSVIVVIPYGSMRPGLQQRLQIRLPALALPAAGHSLRARVVDLAEIQVVTQPER